MTLAVQFYNTLVDKLQLTLPSTNILRPAHVSVGMADQTTAPVLTWY